MNIFLDIIAIVFLLVLPLFLFAATYFLRLQIFVKATCKINTKEKKVLLTFDDGPDSVQTEKILDVLKKHDIKAMFFLIGGLAEMQPKLVRRIVIEGHITGNHSYSHNAKFPTLPSARIERDILKAAEILRYTTGNITPYFRPPYGITNPRIGKIIRKLNYKVIGWSIRSYDTSTTQEKASKRVIRQLHKGAIILLHDRLPNSEIFLEKLISDIKAQGYGFLSPTDI